ncbi:homocysteine-responsive endoplasmic reticulum-resident ubiquitin-like domain member 2 protein [Mytilus californianus]|uniref:homocysteine-responsive endoplasmic reticulum-resident ubiquitin-like domain member 2 protein n=1 Tax=Mytilus californianus TaxID=6549 RepID=UPI002246803A|nr:homocysteine-responsive endoplasmic reticulum-resident ubiquitin-like domain member 2 protein [Mytilus californianus]
MDFAELPVTLVIKAPNQRVGDHTVECMLGWTVKKLKAHLEEVYPSKPKETHQKLIYSGKLLQDHLLLKDVIRQDNTQTHHTVHLVCNHESQERISPQSVSTASPTVNTMPNTEGLRYRNNTPSVQQNNYYGAVPSTSQPQPQPQMMSQAGMTQEQYMVMMQTYYNQMAAQYMQYYQTGAFPDMANIQIAAQDITPQNPQEQVQPNNGPIQQDDNQNVILDARGRVVENVDNDDEFGQHDWLDYIYTFSRFMVLISIVYFYSNFTRFAVVALFFFIVYLYQTGFFRVRRRHPVQRPPQEQAQQQQENVQPDVQQNDNNEQPEPTEESTPQEPPKPSVISIAWSFFSTFFTSLIPSPPPAVNAN